ncbi:glycosyltransferase family 2 protein [Nesterenkonia lutea]|uniref:Glycosyltransferase involved in cell wall biosynthesis n=1 Tax=Nesterenkonia lutea TaxID=272919 RepID=A0ABR9JDY3_9MICC|nr:glycosyltransferase family 2 protein [Nesterenkonia lutea]MBE1524138.1 glycosyltransferase involved in cell wall biosynthesis [Nesterenkonia lutea]
MTAPNPLVSLIVPVHNSRPHIPGLIARLTPQLRDRNEVILVDDGSTDGGSELLEAFAAEHPRVTLIRFDSVHGVARARNAALRAAHGEYVWFADDDDSWSPDILDVFLEAAARSHADIVVCRAELRHPGDDSGAIIDGADQEQVTSQQHAWELILEGAVQGYLWNKLFRRSVLGLDPFADITSQSDFTGVVRAVANSSCVHLIPETLYFHLVREGSITRRRTPDLANLQRAHDIAVDLLSSVEGMELDASVSWFRAWFLILPYGHTPTRVRARWSVRRDGVRRARQTVKHVDMAELRSRSRRTYNRVWLVTRLGTFYLVALHAAQVFRRLSRKVGRRSESQSSVL